MTKIDDSSSTSQTRVLPSPLPPRAVTASVRGAACTAGSPGALSFAYRLDAVFARILRALAEDKRWRWLFALHLLVLYALVTTQSANRTPLEGSNWVALGFLAVSKLSPIGRSSGLFISGHDKTEPDINFRRV